MEDAPLEEQPKPSPAPEIGQVALNYFNEAGETTPDPLARIHFPNSRRYDATYDAETYQEGNW